MRRILLIAGLLAQFDHPARADESPARKRLVEFGWDEPDTSFLRSHPEKIDRTPFDGCVLHVDAFAADGGPAGSLTWHGWDTRAFTDAELSRARADLEAVAKSSRRARTNFLRFNTTPAKLDWFDDHSAVVANAKHAARLARVGGCAGILFDTEQYEGRLFAYEKQRDAKTKPWSVYAAKARERGREVMTAFQSEFPGLHVLLTFGHTLPLRELKGRGAEDLARVPNGLLAPFLDGMIDAAEGRSRIVDGYELSYGYKTRDRFESARTAMTKDVAPIVADFAKYKRTISVGFGLWLDYDWREKGWNESDPSKNHFTPAAFETSARTALELADEYVWIYTEQPRWWTPEGGPVKLPPAYDAALRSASALKPPKRE